MKYHENSLGLFTFSCWKEGPKKREKKNIKKTDIIIHKGNALHEDCGVVGELDGRNIGTVGVGMGAVVNVEVIINKIDCDDPVVGSLGDAGVRVVARVPGQARTQVEVAAIGDRVLVVVALVVGGNLPSQASAAHVVVALGHALAVEDGLGELKPLRLLWRWVLELELGSEHGREGPEGLIVISQRTRPVDRLILSALARLKYQRPLNLVVVPCVACGGPVVKQGPPHCAGVPPVVRSIRRRPWEDSWCLAGLVTLVVRHQVGSDKFCSLFDGRWHGQGSFPVLAAIDEEWKTSRST